MLMRCNVAAGIGSNEQGEYCRAALQRSDRKEPRYRWPTLLYFTLVMTGGFMLKALIIFLLLSIRMLGRCSYTVQELFHSSVCSSMFARQSFG